MSTAAQIMLWKSHSQCQVQELIQHCLTLSPAKDSVIIPLESLSKDSWANVDLKLMMKFWMLFNDKINSVVSVCF